MRLSITIVQEKTGLFRAACPTLPGCTVRRATRMEAIDGLRDAIHGYLSAVRDCASGDLGLRVVAADRAIRKENVVVGSRW
jgi:predicted RNase H-like HicB family nuclease